LWDFRCRHLTRWLLIERKTRDIRLYRIDAMMIEILLSLSLSLLLSMFMLKNEIFITENDVWQAPVVTLFSRRLLSLSSLPLRVLLLWSVSNRRRKNAYIFIKNERERKKIRDWSSPMIGRELIVLCNFWTNNRKRKK
jgi:hypothetical protein